LNYAHYASTKHSDNVDRFRESIIRLGVKIDNGLEKPNQGLLKAEKNKNFDQTSMRALYAHNGARRALGRCIRARASLFYAKIMHGRRLSRPQWSLGSVFSESFCAAFVDPWYGICMRLVLKQLDLCFCTEWQKIRLPDRRFGILRPIVVNLRVIDSQNPSTVVGFFSVCDLNSPRQIQYHRNFYTPYSVISRRYSP